MKVICTLAKWEITRLRSRFSGKSRFVMLPVILLAIVLSFTIYHQDFAVGKGLFTIAATSNVPSIIDPRFNVLIVDTSTGYQMLKKKSVDLLVTADEVILRDDERSQYAAGALAKYLENQELSRIAGQYSIDQAFPLRIQIDYLDTEAAGTGSIAEVADIPDNVNQHVAGLTKTERPSAFDAGPVSSGGTTSGTTASSDSSFTNSYPVSQPSGSSSRTDSQAEAKPPSTSSSLTNEAVQEQLDKLGTGSKLPEFKAQFVSKDDVIVPSLMNPPMPLAQVILAFLYIIPMFFVSVFFTSSFTEEKVNRKLVILLSAPVSRLQVILGKMLPYYVYSILAITAVTILLKGNLGLALAIFIPVMLFIFSIYLMVALTYRTFKDQTFFSVLALSVITVYMVVPAMFTGVNDLSYISPLTLAVNMYRGESFGVGQYLIATLPCYLTFFLVMFIGTRVFNEEYLMGFKPLRFKVMEAIYMTLNQSHLNISIFLLSLLLIPLVFVIQLVSVILALNIPGQALIWLIMLGSIVLEEIAKSLGILTLIRNKAFQGRWNLFGLAAFSALGFWIGEKLLLLLAMTFSSESDFSATILSANLLNGWVMLVPLTLHIFSTSMVVFLAGRGRKLSYLQGILAGSIVHAIYNLSILVSSGALR